MGLVRIGQWNLLGMLSGIGLYWSVGLVRLVIGISRDRPLEFGGTGQWAWSVGLVGIGQCNWVGLAGEINQDRLGLACEIGLEKVNKNHTPLYQKVQRNKKDEALTQNKKHNRF